MRFCARRTGRQERFQTSITKDDENDQSNLDSGGFSG
jgi:hypothetical protein